MPSRAFWLLAFLVSAAVFGQNDANSVVRMLVPGFVLEELPVKLSNQNNLRFAPDGTLTSLGYDGRIWRLRDTDGDGLEDAATAFWDQRTLSVPLGMCWSTGGLYVSSKGKVSLLKDLDGDGKADQEEIVATGWPPTDVGSGGVDATAVTLDRDGNVYFGLLVADYSNAYRLRKRKDLKPDEVEWLKRQSRWREPSAADSGEDEFSLYDLNSPRGTIQKWDPRTKRLSTVANGIRVPVGLAFNSAGDLFNTDQEGETWMPNGNPFDELNHIIPGQNYGFPPRHDQWLPGLVSEPPVVAFAPQHQSACGLLFNEPRKASHHERETDIALPAFPAQKLFGPPAWRGNALVAGQSRARLWRVELIKTASGYVGRVQTIARVSMLTTDVAISPRGELYISCHSGSPDWGTGPQGVGKIFRISYNDKAAPIALLASPASATEVRVQFDKPLHPDAAREAKNGTVEFGEYVSAGDRFEILKPPYGVVQQQDATPRGRLKIRAARLEDGGCTLVLDADPHPLSVRYAITLPGIKGARETGKGTTIDLDYDLTHSSQPLPSEAAALDPRQWNQLLNWAPRARASAGTDSHAPRKPDGDWETGRGLFFSEQLQCGKCHRVRGAGGTAGPDLSNLVHRDVGSVLRDIREPSATLHPDYITHQAVMKDGEVIQGFVRSQQEDAIRMFDANAKEMLLPRAEIARFRPTEHSLMPAGLIDGRKESEVRDLLTFLMWEPPKRSVEEVQRLLPPHAKAERESTLRIVLVASKQDHGEDQHDYPAWQTSWSAELQKMGAGVSAQSAWEWPSPAQFASADVIVFYFWNHDWSQERLRQLDAYLDRGGGVALIHSAVIADTRPEDLAQRVGLSAQPGRTGYRHMPFELRLVDREHPVTQGLLPRIDLLDEPYWPLIGNLRDVRVLAAATIDGESRPLIWVREKGKGRIFASIPGHYTWTLNDPLFKKILLRGIAWAAGEAVDRL